VAATAGELTTITSAGLTAAAFVGTIGAEMIYLARIQMRLVLDLAVVYDLQIDLDDPEDVLMVFGYALGVAPTELLGKGLQVAARAGTKSTVKAVVSKGTLEAIQKFAHRLGFKILQRTIIKYAVPVASAAVGSGYNYVTTKSVGRIAKLHFKHRGRVSDELRSLISKRNTHDLALPAAVMFMAQVDGTVSAKEKEFYRAMLSRMSFEENDSKVFQHLTRNADNVLDAMAQLDDDELRRSLLELLTLMAIYDGLLANEEREFLLQAAERLKLELDIEQVSERAKEYQSTVRKNWLERTAGAAGSAAVGAVGAAGQTAGRLKVLFVEAVKRPAQKPDRTSAPMREDPVESLSKLKQLLDARLINQADFDTKKAEILARL
jgi:hypothetical protein